MTTENTAGRDIVALDARVVRATVSVVSLAGPADLARPTPCADWTLSELGILVTEDHSAMDQIVAMLGRSPAWPQ